MSFYFTQWVSISLKLTKDGACHFKCNLRAPIAGSSWKCFCNWQVIDCRMRLCSASASFGITCETQYLVFCERLLSDCPIWSDPFVSGSGLFGNTCDTVFDFLWWVCRQHMSFIRLYDECELYLRVLMLWEKTFLFKVSFGHLNKQMWKVDL